MSVTEQLRQTAEQIRAIDAEFSSLASVSPHEVSMDPNFAAEKAPDAAESPDMNIFQLNARQKELDAAAQHLNELWLTNSMCKELGALLEGGRMCDADELSAVVENTKKLGAKIQHLSALNLVIAPLLQDRYEALLESGTAMMRRTLSLFLPEVSESTYTVASAVEINDSELTLETFLDTVREYEAFTQTSDVSGVLHATRAAWETHLLEPLTAKRVFLRATTTAMSSSLEIVPAADFSLDQYISSVSSFAAFVNVTGQQPFKNYYATKISNGLVDRISENIQDFVAREEALTRELMGLMDLLSRSNWAMPIRNVFMSHNNIHDSIRQLHLDWTTDKYIGLIRETFQEPAFSKRLADLSDEALEVELPPKVIPEPSAKPPVTAAPEPNHHDAASEEMHWSDAWGSDTDDEKPASQDWDNWDDNWSDSHQHTNEQHTQPELEQIAELEESEFKDRTVSPPQTQVYQIKKSAVCTQLSGLIEQFKAETGADGQALYDTILALATVSYPPLTESFLLLNDLRSVGSEYLVSSAEDEWGFCRQELFRQVTAIVARANLTGDDDSLDAMGRNTDELDQVVQGLFSTDLASTNTYEFKLVVVQLLNLMNTLVLETIGGCAEITEYQSEKFTRYLENVQFLQSVALDRFGEDKSILATHNKVVQAMFLINNHLKSIMEYFYQGELYEFTTDELVKIIKSVFIASDLRENCLREIVDIRSS